MNERTLFRFQQQRKTQVQESEVGRSVQEHARTKATDSQCQSTNFKQMSFQKTSTMQLQQQESETMGTLHARLHQEADKIRKWKIQTELELKEKEKKLTDATLQIETMRQSLLELQLENERTSSRFQEELSCREDVIRRINATREMCTLLQSHASKMEDRLSKCETERTELKYVGKDNMQHIEEVTMKLRNLQIAAAESKKKMHNEATAERNDRIQAEKTMKKNMDASVSEIQRLSHVLNEKDNEITVLQATVQEKEHKLESTEKSVDDLQHKVARLSEEIASKEEELKESSLRISKVQDDKYKLEKMMKELEHEFHSLQMTKDNLVIDMAETSRRLEEQLQKALQDAADSKEELSVERNKLKTVETHLTETTAKIEDLENTRDMMVLEKTDIEMQFDLQKFQMSNLVAEKEEDKEEIHRLNGELAVLIKKLDRENLLKLQAQEETEALQARISVLELEKQEYIKVTAQLKSELSAKQDKMASLESLLSEEESKTIRLQDSIDSLDQKIASDKQHIQEVEEQISELQQETSKKDHEIQLKNQDLEEMLRQLEDLKTVSQEGERAYKATVSELETLRSKVSVQDNKIEELVSQLNDLTDHRTEMVKTLRTKLEKETKATRQHENELSKLREDLDRLAKSKDDAENSLYNCQEEMKNVREQCEHDQEAARLALEKAEEMKASAEKEKQKALALTDCQLAEMMATLDTYKQNNEKLIAEKDAEVKSLLARVESANSLTSRLDKELSEQKKEIDQLKAQIDLNRNEKDDLTWQFREKCDENRELRQRINELESKESKSSTPNCAVQKLANRTPSKLCTPILTSAVSDQEPSKRQSRLSTPRASVIPLKQCPETPASTKLNYSLLKTPQRSILRAYNSVSKRRRVTILAHGKSPPSSSEESDLMELDTASAVSLKVSTPLLLKSPAKTRTSEKMDVSACTPSRIPLSRSSANSVVKQKMQDTQEKEACAELYPSQTYEKVNDSDKSTKLNDGKHLNVRKTPAKKTPRIFSTSPRNKTSTSKTKLRENTKGESDQMAWFELDSVYGFGPED